MKNLFNLFVTLVALALFSSCRKEVDTDIINPTPNNKVRTYTEEITKLGKQVVTTFRLDYDGSGRLVKLVSLSNTGDKFIYRYNTSYYSTDLYNADELVMQKTSFVGSHLLIDSTIQFYNKDQAFTEKYIYDEENKLVRLNQYDYKKASGSSLYNYHEYAYDKYGNISRDAEIASVTTYDYYTDLKCNVVIGPAYLQKPNNLVKTTTHTIGGVTEVFNHSYTFDNYKRLSTEKITKTGSSDLLIKKFTY